MIDLYDYDEAFSKYSKTLENKPMPLHSWDLFSSNFDKLRISFSDGKKLETFAQKNHWNQNWDFTRELQQENVIVVTDNRLNIVFASQNIFEMTGYSSEEIIGENPKMFQGMETSDEEKKTIREAIQLHKPFENTILNYKKNGETYLCHIKAFPVFNDKNELVNFLAFEKVA